MTWRMSCPFPCIAAVTHSTRGRALRLMASAEAQLTAERICRHPRTLESSRSNFHFGQGWCRNYRMTHVLLPWTSSDSSDVGLGTHNLMLSIQPLKGCQVQRSTAIYNRLHSNSWQIVSPCTWRRYHSNMSGLSGDCHGTPDHARLLSLTCACSHWAQKGLGEQERGQGRFELTSMDRLSMNMQVACSPPHLRLFPSSWAPLLPPARPSVWN
jgi:hypothetical protein